MSSRRRENRPQRGQIAQLAARLLVEGSARSFGIAKRKASAALSATGDDLPDNLTVMAALVEYQQLFERTGLPVRNERLRRAALQAMYFLRDFAPRLHGPVLFGTTLQHSGVGLHLFDDEVEKLSRFLMNHRIPYRLGETLYNARKQHVENHAVFEMSRDDVDFELTLLPLSRLKQPLLSPLNAAPYRYLDTRQLEMLLARDPGGLCLTGLGLSVPGQMNL
jgi:hypothetical protein